MGEREAGRQVEGGREGENEGEKKRGGESAHA